MQRVKKTIEKNKKELDKFLDEKLGKLEISKESQNIYKSDLLVSYDFNSVYPSAQVDINSPWSKIDSFFVWKISEWCSL